MKKQIFLFGIISMLFVPMTSAVNIISDVNDESEENYEIKSLDDYKEIITFIDGTCNNVTSKGIYIKRDVTFQGGEDTGLKISGYYRPWNHFNEINVIYIHAPIYIGVIFPHPPEGLSYSIWGFALGDIEWE